MKIGAIMGVPCQIPRTDRCLALLRANSEPETEVIAWFNGEVPDMHAIPCGVEVLYEPQRFVRHVAELYEHGYALALKRSWDWCFFVHDDMEIKEPGWEAHLRDWAARYRIGVAGWQVDIQMLALGEQWGTIDPRWGLGMTADGCAIGYAMELFQHRGRFSECGVPYGWHDWDASLWALSQDWCVCRLPFAEAHRPGPELNARQAIGDPRMGQRQDILERVQHLLPARMVSEHEFNFAGRLVDMRRNP